ncbi:hypothetical protein [Hyphomonas sp.]|uniref:hypothetical protein n=1 Tax=Hyphomonas sp. TaxID=87 RepID=UPI003241C4FC
MRFYHGAVEFLSAAEKLDPGIPRLASTLHAIELALKSYLLTCNETVETLRKREFGHDLRKLIEASISNGISEYVELPTIYEDAIDLLTEAHKSRTLMYEYTGLVGWFVNFSEDIANSLIKPICPWKSRLDAIDYEV